MSKTIAQTRISALEHPISALADRPPMSAEALKAYFDGDPQQLCKEHNALVEALQASTAASQIGFQSNSGISAQNVQEALTEVQHQISGVSAGAIPDGTISLEKLNGSLQDQLGLIAQLQTQLTQLQNNSAPSGAQFPLMILALEQPQSFSTDSLASAALGMRYNSFVKNLGEQLYWLSVRRGDSTRPSAAFRAKANFTEILQDASTLREIANINSIYTLIYLSSEAVSSYQYYMSELS